MPRKVLVTTVVLCSLFALLTFWSCRGCGYAGYGGWHSGPSFWYFGGVRTYHSPSVRSGSRSGPRSGGGLHGGK